MNKYINFFKSDKFARHTGCELTECSPGKAVAQLTVGPEHLNGAGVVHGGVLFTIADYTFAAAANSYGNVALSIETNISFMAKSDSGIITATATVISKTRSLIRCTVIIENNENITLARFNGTAYITNNKIDF